MLNIIKNFTIIALTILAVSLTGKLWFEKISGHNFFYTLISVFTPIEQGLGDFAVNIKPYRIIVNFGNLKYSIVYNDLEQSARKKTADELISAVLQNGHYIGASEFNLASLLKNKGIIYEYPIPISSVAFAQAYAPNGIKLASKIKNVQEVFIFPNRGGAGGIRIVFAENGIAYEYSLSQDSLSKKAMAAIQEIESKDRIAYAESSQSGLFPEAENSFFIPQITKAGYEYHALNMVNPYMAEGGLLKENIKKKLAPFFNDSTNIWADITRETVFTYSADSTVVKYYPYAGFDVIEFFRYPTPRQRIVTSQYSDYSAALNFIARDKLVTNEYYLDKTVQTDNKRTFYFNYVIHDFPIVLGKNCKQITGLTHPIEITVDGGTVIVYKKLACNFESSAELRSVDTDFVSAANRLADMSSSTSEDIQLSLDYIIDGAEIKLDWLN